jgi:hypothetical protein
VLTQAWVNGIAIAVVAASLVNAWLAVRPQTKRAAKPKVSSEQASSEHAVEAQALPEPEGTIHTRESLRWAVLRNEEEIHRRQARPSDAKTNSDSEGSSGE